MAGLLGDAGQFIFGGNANPPTYNTPQLSAGTQQGLANVSGNANESQGQIQGELMSGVTGAGGGLVGNAQSIGNKESALGMTSSASNNAALAARGQRIYGQGQSQLQRQAPMEAAQMQMQRLNQASQTLQMRDKFDLAVAGDQIKALTNQNAARNVVLSQIVGVGTFTAGQALGGAKAQSTDFGAAQAGYSPSPTGAADMGAPGATSGMGGAGGGSWMSS
jgi:hypothetical protein